MTVLNLLLETRDCAGNAGKEVEKAPTEDNLLVCMLDRSVIDIFARHYLIAALTMYPK